MLENWQTLNYLQKNVNHTSSRSQDDETEDSCHERQGCGEGESSVSEGKYYRNDSKFRNITNLQSGSDSVIQSWKRKIQCKVNQE